MICIGVKEESLSIVFSCCRLLIPCLKNYNGGLVNIDCAFLCMGDISRLKAFFKDLTTSFKSLDEIYVSFALCGTRGGVNPEASHLNLRINSCKFSHGLNGTINDRATMKITEVGIEDIELVLDLYNSLHFYPSNAGVTTIKNDVMHDLENSGEKLEFGKEYEILGLPKGSEKRFRSYADMCSQQLITSRENNLLNMAGCNLGLVAPGCCSFSFILGCSKCFNMIYFLGYVE